jgi:hypothetical protein
MGTLSNAALKKGSSVIGVIPEFLKKEENINLNLSQTITVKNMSERKKILFNKGDAFLILPGGSGTIEEATEVISWKFLGIHDKPIIFFNYKKYWQSLFDIYENAYKLNFGNKNLQSISINVKTLTELKSLLN